jgi:hypothetical protein
MTLSVRFTVRMTEDEKVTLDKKASQLNIKASEIVRCATFKYDLPTSKEQVVNIDWDLYHLLGEVKYELNKIGTNINQLAHDANLSLMTGSPLQLQLEELNKISRHIEQSIDSISEVRTLITESTGIRPKLGGEDDRENY